MASSPPISTVQLTPPLKPHHHHRSPSPPTHPQLQGLEPTPTSTSTLPQIVAIGSGLTSTPVIAWTLYTLKTTGCGLPPGPAGSIEALEGVSYLAIVGIVGWSIYTKAKTGSGLLNGPFGLLRAVEGFSYLTLLAILVVFGLSFSTRAHSQVLSLPISALADDCCYLLQSVLPLSK